MACGSILQEDSQFFSRTQAPASVKPRAGLKKIAGLLERAN